MKVKLITGEDIRGKVMEATEIITPVTKLAITIPAGFETDFASVPELFWSIAPPIGLYTEAAIVHDYLYRTPLRTVLRTDVDGKTSRITITRKEADLIFLNMMEAAGVSWWKRRAMYRAVRMFGGSSWREV
jgi:hypothetical protein